MKPFQFYRSLHLLTVHHDGTIECLVCHNDISSRKVHTHYRIKHPALYVPTALIRDLRRTDNIIPSFALQQVKDNHSMRV